MKTFILCLLLISFLISSFGLAREDHPTSLQDLKKYITTFQSYEGELFYPEVFRECRADLDEIFRAAQTPAQSPDFQNQIKELANRLRYWVVVCTDARSYFESLLSVRQRVVENGGEMYAEKAFQEGDKNLRDAARLFQEGRMEATLKLMHDAEVHYRTAEYTAIRNNLLGQVRILLRESEDLNAIQNAPQTYHRVQVMLADVERQVKQTRITDEALSQEAQQLMFYAKHLLTMTRTVEILKKEPGNMEAFLLELEQSMQSLAQELETTPGWNGSYEDIFAQLIQAAELQHKSISALKAEKEQLEIRELTLEKEFLKGSNVTERQQYLQKKLDRIKSDFPFVLVEEGNWIHFRVDSIRFHEETNQFTTQGKAQLRKLSNMLEEFPYTPIIVRVVETVPTALSDAPKSIMKHVQTIKEILYEDLIDAEKYINVVYELQRVQSGTIASALTIKVEVDLNAYLSALPDEPGDTLQSWQLSPASNLTE